DVTIITIDHDAACQYPAYGVGMRIASVPLPLREQRTPADWLPSWRRADRTAGEAIASALGSEVSEPSVARELSAWLPPEATLFVASSMPIRDAEEFAPVRDDGPRVLSNRGANGIDGTVSSAFGAAA